MANDDFDFGFSAVSATELDAYKEVQSLQNVVKTSQETALTWHEKVQGLRAMIMPLLNNLKADPDKEYILWPNRSEKIDAFVKKMDKYIAS